MTPTGNRLRQHRATFALAVCAALLLASALPLTVASCRTQTAPADEPAAYERLRMLTRGGVLPAEPQLAQLADRYKGTRTGSLAQLARARARYAANDYAGAAELLRATSFKSETRVGDYALWLRGDALDKAGRRAEARAAFEELARVYPDSLRARDATLRAEALGYLAQHYARAKQWPQARATLEEMRGAFPQSPFTMRALVAAGAAAKDAKNTADALYFYRAAVQQFPGEPEVAGAQFEIAWSAHDAKNFAESSRLLIEHLANYADRNTDNRGKAGYWAARDSERAGNLGEARTLYEAMLVRYEANWYGYLSRQRLDALKNAGQLKNHPLKVEQ